LKSTLSTINKYYIKRKTLGTVGLILKQTTRFLFIIFVKHAINIAVEIACAWFGILASKLTSNCVVILISQKLEIKAFTYIDTKNFLNLEVLHIGYKKHER